MQLSNEEMRIFKAACADRNNRAAQELINALGASNPTEILTQIVLAPQPVLDDLARNVREAINEQKLRPIRR